LAGVYGAVILIYGAVILTFMDTEYWKEHDMKRAAIHEAGHVIAARVFKRDAIANLIRNRDGGIDNRYWAGQTHFHRGEGERVQAWAGLIAEYLLVDGDSQEEVLLDREYPPEDMSSTDLQLAGGDDGYNEADIQMAIELVQEYADAIRQEAGQLIAICELWAQGKQCSIQQKDGLVSEIVAE
jgi:hypothetical protein